MRILFTFIGGRGHFDPLIPIARAAEAAGHVVAVAGSGKLTSVIAEAGFTAYATSAARVETTGPVGQVGPRAPLDVLDSRQDELDFAESFGRTGARRHAAALPDVMRDWRPDVVVRDEADFGSAISAEVLGVPCATVLVLASGSLLRREFLLGPLGELRSAHGLPPDPDLTMLDRLLVLSPFPPSFRDERFPLPPTAFSYRAGPAHRTRARVDPPSVYFTLGTVFNSQSGDLLDRVIAGLGSVQANVIVTVGERVDPAEFGDQPAHVRIERFVPQQEILSTCDVVVTHGGSGSVMGALGHGLPLVLVPIGADQPHNARRCAELGLGVELVARTVTPSEVARAVSSVLADDAYRLAAGRVQAEINGMPEAAEAVPLLERLGARSG
jgi:UDP:flavonoid glycosyltransferase YjiC (YdhE family)